jgi:hypothetical protein
MADVPLMNNPMTTAGDSIYGGASGAPTRLAIGTAGQVWTVNAGATAPEWATPASGTPTFVGVRAVQTTNTNLTNGVFTALGFDGADTYDSDAFHDPASNNTQFIVPTGKAGKYSMSGFSFTTSSPGNLYGAIRLNGTTIIAIGPGQTNTGFGMVAVHTTYDLAVADYVEFGIVAGAASKQSLDAGVIDPTFEMHKVG